MNKRELMNLQAELENTLQSLNKQWSPKEKAGALRQIHKEEQERLDQVRNLYTARRKGERPDLSEEELGADVEGTIREMTDPERYFLNTTPDEFRTKYGCDQAQHSDAALEKVRSGIPLSKAEMAMMPDFPQEYQEDEDFLSDMEDMSENAVDFDFHAESFLFGHIGRLGLLKRKISGLELIPGGSRV